MRDPARVVILDCNAINPGDMSWRKGTPVHPDQAGERHASEEDR
jgi:hypothetical protein